MTLYFEEEGEKALPIDANDLAKQAILAVLDAENCPYEAEVDLLLTDDPGIRGINLAARGIDRPTDVLSFPANEWETPGEFSHIEEDPMAFSPESGELLLGDIVISRERVLAQAAEYGHSVAREFSFLVVHSMLHLLGYDHMEEDERIVMEERQRAVMEILGLPR